MKKCLLKDLVAINPESIKKDYLYNTIEYIDISSVGSGILFETTMYNLCDAPGRAKRIVRNGDTILSTVRPNRRSFLFIKNPKNNLIVSTGFAVLRPKEFVDKRFLYYFVTNQIFTDYLTNNARGSAYPAVDTDTIGRAVLKMPEFNYQKKIGKILSNYDELIENNNRRIRILEEMAQLIYDEWFVKFKFPGHKNTRFVDSEFGKIPEGWECKSILDIDILTFINKSCSKFDGEKEYFATANIEGITFIKDGEIVTYNNKPSRAQKEPSLNSIWFARMKDTFKVLVFNKANQNFMNRCILSSGMVGFECEEKYLGFFYYTISSNNFHKIKDLHCTGATQMALTNEGMKGIKIILPDKTIIIEYSNIINPFIEQILFLQEKNKNLIKTRDILLPKLISGEIDVSDIEINNLTEDTEK